MKSTRIEEEDALPPAFHQARAAQVMEGARHDLAGGADSVGEGLLADRREQDGTPLPVRREVKEVSGNTLANRAEDVAGERLKNLVQPPRDLFRERPRETRVDPRQRTKGVDVERQERRLGQRLCAHVDRATDRCRCADDGSGSHIPNGDLAPLG